MMKLSIFAFLLLAFVAKEVTSQACHMREIDLCTAIGMFHFQSNGVPSDEEKLDEFCEAIKEVMDCMGNYSSKCMSPLQKEVIGLLAGADEQANKLCTPGTEPRARYLQHAECLSGAAEGDEFKNHIRDLQVALESTFEQAFYQRMPALCCGLKRFQKNLDDTTEQLCGADAVDMSKYVVTMITTDVPDMLCLRYDLESPECQDILPAPGTPSRGAESDSQLIKLLDTVFGNMK